MKQDFYDLENWKDIPGFVGYQVSNFGRIISFKQNAAGRLLKPSQDKDGYLIVGLFDGNKTHMKRVHRLVAQLFIANPFNYPMVNHKDENKLNNCVDNLEWCNNQYNINYGNHNTNVSNTLSRPIRCVETGIIYNSGKEAAKSLGVSPGSIARARDVISHTCKGYHWQSVEGTRQ